MSWKKRKYNDNTMTLWHGSPLRFKESILEKGIIPRCALPISEEQLDKVTKDFSSKIESRYGVKPSKVAMDRAKYWAKIRLEETKGCIYTSGDKDYAKGNCLAGDEWIHGIAEYLIGDLKDKGQLPKELHTIIASREFYPDTKCTIFELEIPIEEAKAVPENKHSFDVYEGKYDDPDIRRLFKGTDDFYSHVFVQVNLPTVDPTHIKKVEVHEKG